MRRWLSWSRSMAKPQYQTPEYRAAYQDIRKAQAAGQWLICVQPVCLHPTRDIAPNQAIDVAHDDSGTVILGPAHRRCNRSDGATRGNQMRDDNRSGARRWLLRAKVSPCAECGANCWGQRCQACASRRTRRWADPKPLFTIVTCALCAAPTAWSGLGRQPDYCTRQCADTAYNARRRPASLRGCVDCCGPVESGRRKCDRCIRIGKRIKKREEKRRARLRLLSATPGGGVLTQT